MGDTVAHALVRSLGEVSLFRSFDDRALLQLVGVSVNLCWAAGTTIFEQGSEAEGLYVVLTGAVTIEQERDGARVEIARLEAGAFFGELSLLERRSHRRAAVAAEDSMLMVLPRASFVELLEEHEEVAEALRRTMAERVEPITSGP